jgi:hypothetical protein
MAQPPKHQRRKRRWLVRFLRGHWRLWSCSVVGLAVFALLPAEGLSVPHFFFAIGLIYRMIYARPQITSGSAPPIRTKAKSLF